MTEKSKIVRVRKFPLEAEAIAYMGQHELAQLKHEELLGYAQQTVLVMSQLRHYAAELIHALEELGYSIESSK